MSAAAEPRRASLDDHGLDEFHAEDWLIARLGQLGRRIDDGVTDRETRAERVRQVILHERLEEAIAGKRRGRPETFSQVFQRIYREPLITESMAAEARRLRSGA